MDEKSTAELVKWGVIGVAAYLVYQTLKGPANAVNSALDSASQSVADLYVGLTSPALSVPQGSVIMPNGSNFPTANLTSMQFGFDSNNTATFMGSDGNTYQLSPQSGGNYTATLVQ